MRLSDCTEGTAKGTAKGTTKSTKKGTAKGTAKGTTNRIQKALQKAPQQASQELPEIHDNTLLRSLQVCSSFVLTVMYEQPGFFRLYFGMLNLLHTPVTVKIFFSFFFIQ